MPITTCQALTCRNTYRYGLCILYVVYVCICACMNMCICMCTFKCRCLCLCITKCKNVFVDVLVLSFAASKWNLVINDCNITYL